MLLRANALAKGVSGIRPVLVERLLEMLNAGVTPVVPARGSCGSSGDLAPLAHLGLVLFRDPNGESCGSAIYEGEVLPSGEPVRVHHVRHDGDERSFWNVNTPADLARASERTGA